MSETARDEIKPSFSVRYIGLATFVALLPGLVGGGIGWAANEYFRDHKMIEVASASSGNLATVAESVAGKLQIQYKLSDSEKETIGGLFKYDVTLANASAEGVENLQIFIAPPKGIELVGAPPSIAAARSEFANHVKLEARNLGGDAQSFVLGLLNTHESITLSFFGVSKNIAQNNLPLSVAVQKKDWIQKNVNKGDGNTQGHIERYLHRKVDQFTVLDILGLMFFGPFLIYFGQLYLDLAREIALSAVTGFYRDDERKRKLRYIMRSHWR